MKALNKFFIVQQFILISLSTGEQELRLRLGVVFMALHGLMEVSLRDNTCEPIQKSINHQQLSSSQSGNLFTFNNSKRYRMSKPCLFRQGHIPWRCLRRSGLSVWGTCQRTWESSPRCWRTPPTCPPSASQWSHSPHYLSDKTNTFTILEFSWKHNAHVWTNCRTIWSFLAIVWDFSYYLQRQ